MKALTRKEMVMELALILRCNVQDLPPVFLHQIKVLKRGIHQELLDLYPGTDPVRLEDWFTQYTTRFDYLAKTIKGTHRHDLNGNDDSLLAPMAKYRAKRLMRKLKDRKSVV